MIHRRINFRFVLIGVIALVLVGWPVYTFVAEVLTGGVHRRGEYQEVDLRALTDFDMDPTSGILKDIPAKYRALDGQKVMLSGQVFPGRYVGKSLADFTLMDSVRTRRGTGNRPKVQERVFCTATAGKELRCSGEGFFSAYGTLHITLNKDLVTGAIAEVYHLDADRLEPR